MGKLCLSSAKKVVFNRVTGGMVPSASLDPLLPIQLIGVHLSNMATLCGKEKPVRFLCLAPFLHNVQGIYRYSLSARSTR